MTARNLALRDNPNRAESDSEFLPPVSRANWLLLGAGFVLVAVCGYLLLRDWFDVAAHHVYAIGLAVLLGIFTIINRRLAKSARELRAAIIRADQSLSAARAAEAKYRSIFENAGEGIFQVAPDGRYLAANPALARILGFASPEDLIRDVKNLYAVLYADPARREDLRRELESKGEVAGFESEIRRPDGTLAWISENIHAVRDEQGVVSHYEGIVAEITDRRRIEAERALRQERKLRHQRCLLELSQFDKSDFSRALAVLVETTSCTLGVARTSAWRLVEEDTEREAIVLLDLFEFLKKVHVTDELVLKVSNFPRYFAALRRESYIVAHNAETDPRTSEFAESYLQPLGITAMLDVPIFIKGRLAGVLCLEHTGGPRSWQDDELAFAAAVGNMIAVTFEAAERRKLNDALAKRTTELQIEAAERSQQASLLNLTHDTIFVRDMHDVITYWNRGAQELYGWTAEEAIGKRAHQLLQTISPVALDEIYAELLRTDRWEGELSKMKADGTRVVVSSRWALVRDKQKRPVAILATNNDITTRKRAEEHIRELNEALAKRALELEATNKELEAFAYSVSHDLRAPLRHMVGYTELLHKNAISTLDSKGRRHILMILEAAQQMGTLIDDLLAFSRMGRAEMHKTKVNLPELIKDVLSEVQRETNGRNISWRVGQLPNLYGDRAMLRLALVNLISNSLKFTRRRAKAEIEIGTTDGGEDEIVVFIRDNGVGFDMKYVKKLFGVFQRLHRAEEFEGTGIGLANVQRIIHRHGGKVWAEGVVDRGATFYFSFPKLREVVNYE